MGATRTPKQPQVNDADKVEARRARKRVTDRQSQRQHRDRQRAYIKQLEETVRSYEASCSESGTADATGLVKEVEKLRERCRNLESTLDRIKCLASGLDVAAACRDASSSRDDDSAPQDAKQATGSALDSEPHNSGVEGWASTDSWHIDSSPVFTAAEESAPAFHLTGESAPDLHLGLDDMEFLGERVDAMEKSTMTCESIERGGPPGGVEYARPAGSGYEPVEYATPGEDLEGYLASLDNGSIINQDLDPAPLLMRDDAVSMVPVNIQLSQEDTGETVHLRYPNASRPGSDWDRRLLSMINNARMQLRVGHYPVAEAPSLRGVLSDKSTDVLASQLYHFLSSYGKMPLHVFLSIFWVQYLFLRWHVVGTRVAYLQMPEFMRPTDLETRIPHQPCIGMLVWPDVRRALIRDSHTADPSHIGTELLRHLSYSYSWSPAAHVTGDLIGSTDVLGIIEHQACQPHMWKVDPSFQKKYPQFASCRLD